MITTNFTVYGRNLNEIQNSAKMISRRFFGDLEAHLDFEITELTAMSGGAEQLSLWQANVHAEWPSPYDGAAAP